MRPSPSLCVVSCCFLIGLSSGGAWGDTDKTIVDLERGPAASSARYSRPRGAQLYQHDKTEIDLATPRSTPSNGAAQSSLPKTSPPATSASNR